MKLRLLVLSLFSIFLGYSPAEAAKLLSWRFDTSQNQLTIRTDTGVQPVVKLISNPTRLVVDLPGTLADLSQPNQMVGGAIKSVRVGQFEENIARLVIELAPGYTIKPEDVKIRGISSNQWVLDLPEAIPTEDDAVDNIASTKANPREESLRAPQSDKIESRDFQVTQNGLFIRFDKRESNKIRVKRSSDLRQIEIELSGVTLPQDLVNKSLSVDEYGVSQIEFLQTSESNATVVLNVDENSPDWLASYSRVGEGGLVLLPKSKSGVTRATASVSRRSDDNEIRRESQVEIMETMASIESITLAANNSELMINSNEKVDAQGSWKANGVYEVRINKAQLSDDFVSPQITANSPISRLRVWQETADTVVVLVHPALGVRLEGDIKQPSEQMLVLQLQELTRVSRAIEPITMPAGDRPPLERAWDRLNTQTPKEKIVVVIDPGHGGKDPGALGINGMREKDLILPVSQRIANILEQQGIQVIMTRNSDYFVTLEERSKMANRANADLFISIHANSMGMSRPDVSGLETYYFSSGMRLAESIHNTVLTSVDVKNRGIRRARFYVLRHTEMPAVLVEIGFVTGKEDAQKLSNPAYREQMAEAIANGILQYVRSQKF